MKQTNFEDSFAKSSEMAQKMLYKAGERTHDKHQLISPEATARSPNTVTKTRAAPGTQAETTFLRFFEGSGMANSLPVWLTSLILVGVAAIYAATVMKLLLHKEKLFKDQKEDVGKAESNSKQRSRYPPNARWLESHSKHFLQATSTLRRKRTHAERIMLELFLVMSFLYGFAVGYIFVMFYELHRFALYDVKVPSWAVATVLTLYTTSMMGILFCWGPLWTIAAWCGQRLTMLYSPTARVQQSHRRNVTRIQQCLQTVQSTTDRVRGNKPGVTKDDTSGAALLGTLQAAPGDGMYVTPHQRIGDHFDDESFLLFSPCQQPDERLSGWWIQGARKSDQHLKHGHRRNGSLFGKIQDGFVARDGCAFWVETHIIDESSKEQVDCLCEGKFYSDGRFQGESLTISGQRNVFTLDPAPPSLLIPHVGVVCDGCSMSPIRGPRYKARTKNYDLCQACIDDYGNVVNKSAKADEAKCVIPNRDEFVAFASTLPWEVHDKPGVTQLLGVDQLLDAEETIRLDNKIHQGKETVRARRK